MKKFKTSFMKFTAILLSLVVTFGVGNPVLAISGNVYRTEEQTVVIEDNIETNEAEETDEEEELDASEEADETDSTHDNISNPVAMPEIQMDKEKSEETKEELVYDPQPVTIGEVRTAIDVYETEYQFVLAAKGFLAALNVPKPRWQYEVAAVLMPEGYNCQLVDWDEDFGTEYYTFFPNPVEMAGFGDGEFANKPPEGLDISSVFPTFVGDTRVDSKYTNVAIATFDKKDQFGAMWAKEKLDLSMPFSTNMYLHLGHSLNPADERKVADGMTFTMHNHEPALTAMVGGKGEGLGVYTGRTSDDRPHGVFLPNSLVIEFDTYINDDKHSTVNDPVSLDTVKYAHCALVYPRTNDVDNPILPSDHKNVCFFEPTQDWIPFEVKWEVQYDADNTLGGTLTYSFAGMEQVEEIEDVEAVFGGTEVWWGFTGATGAQTAVQAAAITKLPSPQYRMDVVKSVKNADEEDIDEKYAYSEDILTYTIRVTGGIKAGGSRIGPISIEDKLSKYVKYVDSDIMVTMSDGTGPFSVVPTVVPGPDGETLTVDTGCYLEKSEDWLEITFKVKVNEDTDVGTVVENTAKAEAENLEDPAQSNTTRVTIADTSRKTVASDSAAGVSGAAVTVGEYITYEIYYYNHSGSTADLTITDALHAGVEYQRHTGGGGTYAADTRTVTWQISGVGAGEHGSVTVTVKVKSDIDLEAIDNKLVNTAKLIWSTNPDAPEELTVQNPVAGYKVTYVGNGGVTAQNDVTYVEGLFPVGDDYTVRGNDEMGFAKSGCIFLGWNTARNGSGEDYDQGDIFYAVTSDITLYAQWGRNLVFRKIDAESVHNEPITGLTGARFELYKCIHVHDTACGEPADPYACTHTHSPLENTGTCWELSSYTASYAADDSIVIFTGLTDGIYLLMETTAPDGYRLPKGQWIVEVESDKILFTGTSGDFNIPAVVAKNNFYGKEADSSVEFWIGNIRKYVLPAAGHVGMFWLMALGGLLLMAGLLMGILVKYSFQYTDSGNKKISK